MLNIDGNNNITLTRGDTTSLVSFYNGNYELTYIY